jgi:hypothetical protein
MKPVCHSKAEAIRAVLAFGAIDLEAMRYAAASAQRHMRRLPPDQRWKERAGRKFHPVYAQWVFARHIIAIAVGLPLRATPWGIVLDCLADELGIVLSS